MIPTDYTHQQQLNAQKLIDELAPLLRDRPAVYADAPFHYNTGDCLIEMGTWVLFKQLNISVIETITIIDSKKIARIAKTIPNNAVIILHGGGNFGDLYPKHQALRLAIFENFPNHQIIMLPQSVHFDNPASFTDQTKIIKNHPNYILYARDIASQKQLNAHLSSNCIGLLPDMATLLHHKLTSTEQKKTKKNILHFRRQDIEMVRGNAIEDGFDWKNNENFLDHLYFYASKKLLKQYTSPNLNKLGHVLRRKFSERLINKAIKKFALYQRIDSDRLHGVILAMLLQKEIICRDNSYGKIHNYISTWYE